MPEAKERLSWLGRLKERLGRSAMSTIAETELLEDANDEKDEVEYVILFGDKPPYAIPKGLIQKLQPTERSQEAILKAIDAYDELYLLLARHLVDLRAKLALLPEDFRDTAVQTRRESIIKEMADLDDFCLRLKDQREDLAEYEDYMRMTSVSHRFRIPNPFG